MGTKHVKYKPVSRFRERGYLTADVKSYRENYTAVTSDNVQISFTVLVRWALGAEYAERTGYGGSKKGCWRTVHKTLVHTFEEIVRNTTLKHYERSEAGDILQDWQNHASDLLDTDGLVIANVDMSQPQFTSLK